MQLIVMAAFAVLVIAVGGFIVYCVEHSPTAKRGKYRCYGGCGGPLSAERAGAGRDCPACESRSGSSED